VREYNYQYAVSLQHELRRNLGISVGYYRTDWRNQTQTVNVLHNPSDYSQYCITAPADARLGGMSGQRICGLYDVNPDKRSASSRVLMTVQEMNELYGAEGRKLDVYNGMDVGFNWRFRERGLLQGGVSIGRQVSDECYLKAFPNLATGSLTDDFCRTEGPLWSGSGSQIKLQAIYPLPWDFTVSGSYKHLPGIGLSASLVVPNAAVLPTLGRNLSACAPTGPCNATTTVSLLPSRTLFDDRLNQIDLRFTRSFRVSGMRIQGGWEVYNVTNTRPSQSNSTTYNATWLRPSVLLGGRVFRFGTQVDF
jgi:hypothetical protein